MSNPAGSDLPGFLWTEERPRRDPSAPVSHRADGRRIPGETGLWIFILGDLAVFGAFFVVFLVRNRADRELFAASAGELLVALGAVNTLVLLLSSYLVVVALRGFAAGDRRLARSCVTGAMACAWVFVALKAVEYTVEISAGHTPRENDFFLFYFALTGIHLLHVLVGLVLLEYLRRRARSPRAWAESRTGIECAAVYWHMVDLLWIIIFTLVYLVCVV